MWKDEWDFWTSPQAELELKHGKEVLLQFARKNLPPIQGQIKLIDHPRKPQKDSTGQRRTMVTYHGLSDF
jgi:hypothetical protein